MVNISSSTNPANETGQSRYIRNDDEKENEIDEIDDPININLPSTSGVPEQPSFQLPLDDQIDESIPQNQTFADSRRPTEGPSFMQGTEIKQKRYEDTTGGTSGIDLSAIQKPAEVSYEKGFDRDSYEDEEFEKNDDDHEPVLPPSSSKLAKMAQNDIDQLEMPLDISNYNEGKQIT